MAGELPVLNLCDECTPELIAVENGSNESIGGCSGKEVKTEFLQCKTINESKEVKQNLTDDENSTIVKIISDHENSPGDFTLPTEETNISIAESHMDSGYLDEISCENDTEKLISRVEDKSIEMPDASVKGVLPSDPDCNLSVVEEKNDTTLPYESPKKNDRLFKNNQLTELDTSELPAKKLKSALKGLRNLKGNHDKRVTFCDRLTIYSEDFPSHEKIISLEEHLSSKFYNWKLDESSGIFPELEGLFGNSFTDSAASKSFGPTLQRWFELDADSQNTVFGAQDDDTEDFFVHKVIYDSQILQEDDGIPEMQNEECDSVVYGCHINQDECQEFIVHQVAQCESECESSSPDAGELESDLDLTEKNPSEKKSDLSPENKSDMEQNKLCKLSVENILQHDRLTEERARSDNLVSVLSKPSNSCSDMTDQLILSPPLQELGLEKLTRSQEDGTVWRLEISPLNSVQETDSDTSASSEDTMIMMTSEECERNEQHIRESFQQFECIKRGITENHKQNDVFNENSLKAPDINSAIFSTPEELELDAVEKVNSLLKVSSKSLALKNHPRKTSGSQYSCSTGKSLSVLVSELVTSEQWPTESDHSDSLEEIFSFSDLPVMVNCDSMHNSPESIHSSKMNSVLSLSMPDEQTCKFSSSSSSHSSQSTSSRVWDSTLASIEIPHDVREWKITLNSPNDSTMQNQVSLDEYASSDLIQNKAFTCDNFEDDKCDIEDITSKMPCNRKILQGTPRIIHASDELEHFVQQCSERIERIRKRYSLTEEVELSLGFVRKPSVRGIRPRFGSTAEILKQMQTQLHPPLLASSGCTGSHLTWPYCSINHPRTASFSKNRDSTALLSDIVEEVSDSNSFNNLPPHHRHHHYSFQDITANAVSSNSSPGMLLEKYAKTSYMPPSHNILNRNKDINSTMPNLISETDERGTPEGASSPKFSTDSLCQQVLHQQLPLPEEGVIYYSMKI